MLNNLIEQRAISFQTLFANGEDFETSTQAGTFITPDTAFKINAVFSAVSLISDTISTLPLGAFKRTDGNRIPFLPQPEWVTKPDVDTTREAFLGQIIVSMLLEGGAFVRYFTQNGRVVNLTVLNPAHVEIKRTALGQVIYKVTGEREVLTKDQIIYIPDVVKPGELRGISRIEALKENFGLAMALENFAARFFGQGANTSGIIEFPEELSYEQAANIADAFDRRHRGWRKGQRTGVLSAGAKYVQTTVTNDQAQFLDSRRMAVEDVARAFNVPPHLLGLPGTTSYASVEQNNLAWVTHGLRPIITKIENALTPLLAYTPGGQDAFLRINIDGLLRADINSRFSAYSTGLQSGFLSIDNVRLLEDLPKIGTPEAEQVRVPLANIDLASAGLVAEDRKILMAQRLINAGFLPEQVLAAMGLPPIEHSGIAPVMVQPLAGIDPNDPKSAYGAI